MADAITYQWAPPTDLNAIPSVADHAAQELKKNTLPKAPSIGPILLLVALLYIFKGK